MGTIIASSVIAKAQIILQDVAGVRWPSDTELLGWLNDGQREVAVFKPNAYVKHSATQLAPGTRQAVPADCISLVDVVRNMGTNGTTPGRAIRVSYREVMDAQVPNWHAATPRAEVRHFMYSALDPKVFWVYPPQPDTAPGFVEIVYGAVPVTATFSGPIQIDDIYQNVLVDYILYRAFSKDTEAAAEVQRAATYQAAYMAALTGKARLEAALNPNTTAPANVNPTPNVNQL